VHIPTNAKPSAETTSVGIRKNKTLRIVLLRLAAKNSPNNHTPTIQNLGDKIFSTDRNTSTASPVAFDPFDPLRVGY